jgi:DNA-binding ferritin-like protein
MEGMTRLGDDDFEEKGALLNVLLGKDRTNNDAPAQSNGPAGSGLLREKLGEKGTLIPASDYQYAGKKWSWGYIIEELKFAIECQVPGKDYGANEGQNLSNCGNLIAEYLKLVGVVKNEGEVKIDPIKLVLPILQLIQAELLDYYKKAVAKYAPDGINIPESENNDQQNNNNKSDTVAVFYPDQDQGIAEYVDRSTPAGQARLDELLSQGYTIMKSKHIDVTLQKVTGTTSFNMTMISANYDPSLVLSDMEEIIGQPEFIESLPEELTTYSIEVDDDGFDIEPCEECIECNPCESLCEVFKSGIRAYRNLYILHWMSSGNDMMKLHTLSEETYGELSQEIDTIGELLVEKQGTVPQLDFACDYIPVQKYDFQTGLDQIKSLISMYIDCIDYAYCNQDSDVQSTLDEWLRYWNKQLNYFVKGQEV